MRSNAVLMVAIFLSANGSPNVKNPNYFVNRNWFGFVFYDTYSSGCQKNTGSGQVGRKEGDTFVHGAGSHDLGFTSREVFGKPRSNGS